MQILMVRVSTTVDDLIVVYGENMINVVSREATWIIDTSASLHVTPCRELFSSYTFGEFGVLKLGMMA